MDASVTVPMIIPDTTMVPDVSRAPSSIAPTLSETPNPSTLEKSDSIYRAPTTRVNDRSSPKAHNGVLDASIVKTQELRQRGFSRWGWMLSTGSRPTNAVRFPYWRYKGINLSIHASPDKSSSVVAAVKFNFDPFETDFRICIGDPWDASHGVWVDVKADSVWRPSAYSFTVPMFANNTPSNDTPSTSKTFTWKTPILADTRKHKLRTHRRRIFRYVELVDDANNVIAVFEAPMRHPLRARFRWMSELSREEELACIAVLLGVYEEIRESMTPSRPSEWPDISATTTQGSWLVSELLGQVV
ncbi:hypothetical protein H2203_006019 [Taxawa tesnikishii (nom. ined.)]|nr:hypothetical protein H2203_006019 [Dothideales sp. JES 119]